VSINNNEVGISDVFDVLYCSAINECNSKCDKGFSKYIDVIRWISNAIEGKENELLDPHFLLEELLCLDSFERQKDGTFTIDKKKLKKEIEREYSLPISICQKFDKNKIMSQVDALPDKFTLPEEYLDEKTEFNLFDKDTIEGLQVKAEIVAPIFAKAIAKELEKVIIANFGTEKNAKQCAVKADALYEFQRYEESLECYTKALDLDPANAEVWYKRGELLEIGFEKYNEAIKSYEKAMELNPNMFFALQAKGVCLDSLGKYDEAIVTYEKVIGLYKKQLEQNPNDEETKENLQTVEENLSALKS
jgi:tetratricopeptide (TPR) repeat protein